MLWQPTQRLPQLAKRKGSCLVRILISTVLACGVALLLFLFMVGLVANQQTDTEMDQSLSTIELVAVPEEPPPPEQTPTEEEPPPAASEPEPAMAVPAPASVPIAEAAAIELPQVAVNMDALALSPGSDTWSSGLAGSSELDVGQAGTGYVEVVPLATRTPNIPKIAWTNKIDGWVLVAFTLKTDGRTKNIRILDSHPRGIFEEKAIKAVEDWLYDMNSIRVKGEIVLTQRIELTWKDYPNNNLYLDQ